MEALIAERDSLAVQLQQTREDADNWKGRHSKLTEEVGQFLFARDAALAELAEARKELDWQNNRNSGHPTRGGYEFYINEEWTGLANAALDGDYGWHASLKKKRDDPDDERVRVRRTIEDDALLAQLSAANDQVQKAEHLLQFIKNNCRIIYHWPEGTNYPLEHNPHAKKDCWSLITSEALASAPASTSVRSDSERLDWLEKEGNPVVLTSPDMSNKNWLLRAPGCKGRYLTLRAAIDAAMSQRTGE